MSARMQFCGRFPGLRAVSGIWSGAAADSLSLGSKRSGCVGLQSTQPKHRRFETVRLSASRPSAGRSTQSPGTSAKLLHGRTRGAVSGWMEGQGQGLNLWDCVEDGKALLRSCCLCVKGGKALLRSCCLCGVGRQGAPAELLAVCGGRQSAPAELLPVCEGRQGAPAELLPVWCRTAGCSCGVVGCVWRTAKRSCGAVACV